MEMPDIQALYEDWDENAGELVVLGVAGPNIGQEAAPKTSPPSWRKTATPIPW